MKATTFRRKSIVQVLLASLILVFGSGQFAQAQGVCGRRRIGAIQGGLDRQHRGLHDQVIG